MPGTLEDIIRAQIAAHGPIDVGAFMALALGHPRHGYYITRDPFGGDGDFVTAPEISQIFGELVGAWAADIWAQMGRPGSFVFLECGPGRGTLMADALRATRKAAGFHDAARIVLLETSPALRAVQARALAGFAVDWAADIDDPAIPAGVPVIAIANEFLDALPVRQFVKRGALWHERVVGVADDALAFGLSPPVEPPIKTDGDAPDGIYEIAPARNEFVRALARRLRAHGGAALLVDYGYERSAPGDTLQAVRAHGYVPVLDDPGMVDITAHVDFQAIATAARGEGAIVHGPVAQGDFLRALGIGIRAEMLKGRGDPAAIEAAVWRLTDAAEMGTLFKVMALCAGEDTRPAGFP